VQEVHRCNSERRPVQMTTPTGATVAPQDVKKATEKAPLAPDPLFDAVTSECGIDVKEMTSSSRGAVNRSLKELREAGATPKMVRVRARRYRARHPDAALTPSALTKHWPTLGRDEVRQPREVDPHWEGGADPLRAVHPEMA
jgi:biotin operon repressor